MSEIEVTGFETMSPEMEFTDNYNNWILSIFAPYIKGNVLEIGTGQGNFKKYFADKIAGYVSVDIDEDVIARAKQRDPAGNYLVEDASKEAFVTHLKPFNLDAVLCVNVLEHIPEHQKAFTNMVDVLKPGGHLLLFVPAFKALYNDLDSLAGHIRRYKKDMIYSLVDPAKHEVVLIEYFNPVGGVGWWMNNFVTHKKINTTKVNEQVKLFDRYVVPVSKVFNNVTKSFFGQSVIAVIKKRG